MNELKKETLIQCLNEHAVQLQVTDYILAHPDCLTPRQVQGLERERHVSQSIVDATLRKLLELGLSDGLMSNLQRNCLMQIAAEDVAL